MSSALGSLGNTAPRGHYGVADQAEVQVDLGLSSLTNGVIRQARDRMKRLHSSSVQRSAAIPFKLRQLMTSPAAASDRYGGCYQSITLDAGQSTSRRILSYPDLPSAPGRLRTTTSSWLAVPEVHHARRCLRRATRSGPSGDRMTIAVVMNSAASGKRTRTVRCG